MIWGSMDTSPEMLARAENEALRWINEMRGRFGAPALRRLPKGRRGNANACPLAMAMTKVGTPPPDDGEPRRSYEPGPGVMEMDTMVHGQRHHFEHRTPRTERGDSLVWHFAVCFDGGKYPHLEAR